MSESSQGIDGIQHLQDHRPGAGDRVRMGFREVPFAARVSHLDPESGLWIYQESTLGDVLCQTCWYPSTRALAGWANAWPTVNAPPTKVTTPTDGGGARKSPVVTQDGSAPPTTSVGGGSASYSMGDWFSGIDAKKSSDSGNPKGFTRPPVWVDALPCSDGYSPDGRFQSRAITLDGTFPKPHRGMLGVAIASTSEGHQETLWFPTDPRLVAANADGDPAMSSLVCDLDSTGAIDPTRTAYLHSMLRVIKNPAGRFPFGGDNMLALNYAPSGRDGIAGFGAVYDRGTTQNGFAYSTPAVVTGELKAGPLDSLGRGTGMVLESVVKRQGTINFGGANVSGQGGMAVALMSRRQAYGPIEVGSGGGDQHEIGIDADGNKINSAHLSTASLFFGSPPKAGGDGPLDFLDWLYPKPKGGPEIMPVHLTWDPASKHDWLTGQKQGKWRWTSQTVIATGGGTPSKPKVTTPGDPPSPPNKPPTPVTPKEPPTITPPTITPTGAFSAAGVLGGGPVAGWGFGRGVGGKGSGGDRPGGPVGGSVSSGTGGEGEGGDPPPNQPGGGVAKSDGWIKPGDEPGGGMPGMTPDATGKGSSLGEGPAEGPNGDGPGPNPGGLWAPPYLGPGQDPGFPGHGWDPHRDGAGPEGTGGSLGVPIPSIPPGTIMLCPVPYAGTVRNYPYSGIPSVAAPGRSWDAAEGTTLNRPWRPGTDPEREARSGMQTGFPTILVRAPNTSRAAINMRTSTTPGSANVAENHRTSPTVARIEGWGAQRADGEWAYAARPGQGGRYEGGLSAGGWFLMPPQHSIDDYTVLPFVAPAGITPTTAYLAAAPGAYFGAGYPNTQTGELVTGYRWGTSSAGVLAFQRLSSSGVATTVFGGDASSGFQFREGGATLLTVGSIADGYVLTRSGTSIVGVAPSGVAATVVNRVQAQTDVVSSTTETSIYTFTVPGGTLGSTRALRLTLGGDFLNNTGTSKIPVLRVKYGGTTLFDDSLVLVSTAADRRGWNLVAVLTAYASASVQEVTGYLNMSAAVAPSSGFGHPSSSTSVHGAFGGASAEDSTGNLDLVVTIQLETNSASYSWRLRQAMLELL